MTPEPNFEDMSFKPFTVNEHSTINPKLDLDTNFFESIFSLDTKYFTVNETKAFVTNIDSQSFTVLCLNISMKKIFESFQEFLKDLKFNFKYEQLYFPSTPEFDHYSMVGLFKHAQFIWVPPISKTGTPLGQFRSLG